jgi:hypothetical protein
MMRHLAQQAFERVGQIRLVGLALQRGKYSIVVRRDQEPRRAAEATGDFGPVCTAEFQTVTTSPTW